MQIASLRSDVKVLKAALSKRAPPPKVTSRG